MVSLLKSGLSFLRKKENRHLRYTWILIAYLAAFFLVERIVPADRCAVSYLPLDDRIPLLEWFLIPYMLWLPMLAAMGTYLAVYDREGYRKYMIYMAVAFFSTLILYLLFPSKQELRPIQLPRQNFFTWGLGILYRCDTNTNVCPSLHVIGSFAVVFAAWNCKRLRRLRVQAWIWAGAFLVAVSTVFIKQHSILDLLLAVPHSIVAYELVYRPRKSKKI